MATETPASLATSFIVAIDEKPSWVSVYILLSVAESVGDCKPASIAPTPILKINGACYDFVKNATLIRQKKLSNGTCHDDQKSATSRPLGGFQRRCRKGKTAAM
ncbi:hypothetical protein CPI84_03760 [Erwinia pyrifoliae]|nr:hypothetical protein CPI84_03760 [Erwinia pyrifoliae]MCA8878091.1 hypothetical protein [Erwinia pyrifoliae]